MAEDCRLAVSMPIDDLGDDVSQIGVGLDIVELAGLDERSDDCPVLAATIRAREERILAREGDWPDAALDHVRIDLNAAVVKKARQPFPAGECIADSLGQLALLADQAQLAPQPRLEGIDDGATLLLADAAARFSVTPPDVFLYGIEPGDPRQGLAGDGCRT